MENPRFRLSIQSGAAAGKAFVLDREELLLGRSEQADITLPDPEISRRHARLVRMGSGYQIEDLGSTNGTFVNGVRLSAPRMLQPGDRIQFGLHTVALYEAERPDTEATLVATPPTRQSTPPFPRSPLPAGAASPSPSPSPAPPPPPPASLGPMPSPPSGKTPSAEPTPPPVVAAPLVEPADAEGKREMNWLLFGTVLALVVLACFVGAALWYIDAHYLWCEIFPFLAGCP